MKKNIFKLLLLYLVTIPLLDHLNLKIIGKIGVDNIFLLLIFILTMIFVQKVKKHMRIHALLFSLFFIATFVPTLSSFICNDNVSIYSLTIELRYIQMIIILIIFRRFICTYDDFKKIAIAYFAGAVIAALFGIGQAVEIKYFWEIAHKYYLIGKPHLTAYKLHQKSPSFWPESGNAFGAYMVMSSLFIIGCGKYIFKDPARWLFFLVFGLVTSLSITSFGIFFTITPFLLYFFLKNNEKKYVTKIIIGISLAFLACYLSIPGKINNRIGAKLGINKNNPMIVAGMNKRAESWRAYSKEFKKQRWARKLIGSGYSDSGIRDNYYLELLGAGGWISLVAFIFLIIYILHWNITNIIKGIEEYPIIIHITFIVLFVAIIIMCTTGSYLSYLTAIIPLLLLAACMDTFKGSHEIRET